MQKAISIPNITAVLTEVANEVVGHFEMQALLNKIINTTMKALHAEVCSIFLEDKEKEPGVIKCVAGSGFARKIVGIAKYKIGEGFTGTVAKIGEPFNIKNHHDLKKLGVNRKEIWQGKYDHIQWPSGKSEFRNLLALPLKIKDQTLGVIKVENKIEKYGEFFTEEDMTVFKIITNVISLTIENARLYKQAEDQLKTITNVIVDVANSIVGHFNMAELLMNIINTTMRALHAEVCSIFLEDKENEPDVLKCVAGSGFAKNIVGKAKYRVGEGLTGTVAKLGIAFNIKSQQELREGIGEEKWKGKYDSLQWPSGKSEFKNLLALPLKIKDQILGVIKVENKIDKYGKYFSEEDLTLFSTIANVIALTIENARLHKQIEDQLKIIAAKAAHRINNQITRYDGIELDLEDELSSDMLDKDAMTELIDRLKVTTKNLKRMVNEFKEYGKPIKLTKEPTDINALIKQEAFLADLPKTISIVFKTDESIPKINIDIARFSESIKELLNNAKTAITESGNTGKISITTELIEKRQEREERNSFIKITIEDDGPGIPESFPIFSPFHTTNPQGTGLGLATVKEIVNTHNGTIDYIPHKKGACFQIVIPLEGQSI